MNRAARPFRFAAPLALGALTAAAPLPIGPAGLWLNPRGTVAVRAGPCADRLCGWVAWASARAQADAREEGVDRLIGVELLRDYRAAGDGSWTGTVYVPDMGRSFSSTLSPAGPGRLRIKGCLIGGFLCKAQVWRRIDRLPDA